MPAVHQDMDERSLSAPTPTYASYKDLRMISSYVWDEFVVEISESSEQPLGLQVSAIRGEALKVWNVSPGSIEEWNTNSRPPCGATRTARVPIAPVSSSAAAGASCSTHPDPADLADPADPADPARHSLVGYRIKSPPCS